MPYNPNIGKPAFFEGIYPFFYLSTCLSTYLSIYLSTFLHFYLSTYLPASLSAPICLSTYLPICLSTYLPIHMLISLSTYPPICLSVYLPICCLSGYLSSLIPGCRHPQCSTGGAKNIPCFQRQQKSNHKTIHQPWAIK